MKTLKVAVQKKGRLFEDSIGLLKDCGIKIDNTGGQLKAKASNFPIEILYLRNSDIPKYVESGVADIAIVGANLLEEEKRNVSVLKSLGFSKCTVDIAIPKDSDIRSISDLEGKRIATSYPQTLLKFLNQNQINCEIHEISGSVEIAPNIGLADAICDIVSTGSTLFKNGLESLQKIFASEAVLIRNNDLDLKQMDILNDLLFRIDTIIKAQESKYVLMNVPNEAIPKITSLLPVLKSPTILPLAMEGWSSLHTVISENKFWEIISQIKKEGAEGILVIPIEKMVV